MQPTTGSADGRRVRRRTLKSVIEDGGQLSAREWDSLLRDEEHQSTYWQDQYITLLRQDNASLKRRVKELQLRDYRLQEKMEKLMLNFNLLALKAKDAEGATYPETLDKVAKFCSNE